MYLKDPSKTRIPPQWHVEASTGSPAEKAFAVTVLRPFKKGARPQEAVRAERQGGKVTLRVSGKTITLRGGQEFFTVR